MGIAEVMLSALNFPRPSIDLTNEQQCKALLIWLENQKIRLYKPEDRGVLKESPDWATVLAKYLVDAECPLDVANSSLEEIFRWLIVYAVSLEYNDNADALRKKAQQLKAPKLENGEGGKAVLQPYQDLTLPAVQQQMAQLLELLHVKQPEAPFLQRLQAAQRVLEDELLPLAAVAAASDGNLQPKDLLSSLPLGFDTGDEQVDQAATVLRLLHVKQLRQLQTQIDGAIVALQEYTANPRTDSSLGKVGR